MKGLKQSQYRALIVDDDKSVRQSLIDLLQTANWHTEAVDSSKNALSCIDSFHADVILSDVRMPEMDGFKLLEALHLNFNIPLVFISAHGDIPMAVKAMSKGAYSFLEKPYDPHRLLRVLNNAAAMYRLSLDADRLRERLNYLSGLNKVLIGKSSAICQLRDQISGLLDVDSSILLIGETGTGKELVANALHDLSQRAARPFSAINCANILPDLFEKDMFGELGGSAGRLSECNGGTLFLDEIGEFPSKAQAKLLRVLEEKCYTPLGDNKEHPVDIRLICASNENIEQLIADKKLRKDLYYRISTMTLHLPSLRQRRDDITLLFTHFIQGFARLYESEPFAPSENDISMLLAHDWPGNVRELRNVAERCQLSSHKLTTSVSDAIHQHQQNKDASKSLRKAVSALEHELIARAIKRHNGKMEEVAEDLGIGRRTLNEKIVKLSLDKSSLLTKSNAKQAIK